MPPAPRRAAAAPRPAPPGAASSVPAALVGDADDDVPAPSTPQAAPPGARREGDLRTAVLDAARQLLVHEGYRDLSMRDVARRVGCSVSSIYLYFAGKDELVHTLMDEGFERWHRRMSELATTDGTPRDRLAAVCRAYVEFGLANPEFYEIMYMFHSDRMARYPKELFRRARRNLELMGALIAEYAPEAVPTPDDVRVSATALWATLHGIVSTIVSDRLDRRLDRERYVAGAIRYALAGVRHAAPAAAETGGPP